MVKPVLISNHLIKKTAQDLELELQVIFLNVDFCIKEERSQTWAVYASGRFGFNFEPDKIKEEAMGIMAKCIQKSK